jgi:hypothetical protein
MKKGSYYHDDNMIMKTLQYNVIMITSTGTFSSYRYLDHVITVH